MRTRWAMVLAPVSFVAVFELARIGAVGPTVDRIHLSSTYGILAFAVGRGFHGLVALVPMLLGAALRPWRDASTAADGAGTDGRGPRSGPAARSPRC